MDDIDLALWDLINEGYVDLAWDVESSDFAFKLTDGKVE